MRLFALRLAKDFHELDVDAMLSRITATQLYEWLDFYMMNNATPAPQEQTPDEMFAVLDSL